MDLRQQVESLRWFHQIDFGDGLISPGETKLEYLKAQADIYFPPSLEGKSVLDIGCWDGFNSFEAYRRGAKRVLATDYHAWNIAWGDRRAFELGRTHLAPRVEVKEIDLPELSTETAGVFDVVIFAGVLYHLPNPIAGLMTVRPLVKQTLILETHIDAADIDQPAAIFYADGFRGDLTNWWGPNRSCVEGMLHRAGFKIERYTDYGNMRGIFHARPI
jgi:tRNA (mo5U34)-methyltransferase